MLSYWGQRLELADPGDVDADLAPYTESDLVALRTVLRQASHLFRPPLGLMQWTAATIASRILGNPELAVFAAQVPAVAGPDWLAARWAPPQATTPVAFRQLEGHNHPVTACLLTDGGTRLVTCAEDEIRCWDTVSGRAEFAIKSPDRAEVLSACAPLSGDWIATVQVAGGRLGFFLDHSVTLRVWDLRAGSRGEVRTLRQDDGQVCSCLVSPDGRLASLHPYGEVALWDSRTWQLEGVIQDRRPTYDDLLSDADRLPLLCWSPDGTWLAVANADGAIGLWDPSTRARIRVLSGHRSRVTSMVSAPDGRWLASTDQRDLRIWDTSLGAAIHRVRTPKGCGSLLPDRDGRWVAASFGADNVQMISVDGPVKARSRRAPASQSMPGSANWIVTSATCEADADGGRIFSLTGLESRPDRRDRISQWHVISSWDSSTGIRLAGPSSRRGEARDMLVELHGRQLVVIDDDKAEIVDAASLLPVETFNFRPDRVRSGATSAGWVALGFNSGAVRLLRPELAQAGSIKTSAEPPPADLHGCLSEPFTGSVLVWSRCHAAVLDARDGSVRIRVDGQETGVFLGYQQRACCAAADGSWLATADDDGTIQVWELSTGTRTGKARGKDGEEFVLAQSASTRWMATHAGGRLQIRDRSGTVRHTLGPHERIPTGLHDFPGCAWQDSWLAIEERDGTRVWDPLRGKQLTFLPGERGGAGLPPEPGYPNGLLATIGPDGEVRITEPTTGQRQATYQGMDHQPAADDIGRRIRAVHPGGHWLVTADDQGTLTVWERHTGKVRRLITDREAFVACSVTPDGTMLAAVQRSGAIRIWEHATWQQIAALRLDGPLTGTCWAANNSLYAVGGPGAYRLQMTSTS